MPKEAITHKDKLGRLLKLDDYVVYPDRNSLGIGTIKKLNTKMVRIGSIGRSKYWNKELNKYPHDIVIVNGPEVTMYLLKIEDQSPDDLML